MLTAYNLFSAGGFFLRMGQAVAVSVAGIAFAVFAMFLVVMPLMALADYVLPDLPFAMFDQVTSGEGEAEAERSLGWAITTFSAAVPLLVVLCLLMPDGKWWLRALSTTVLIVLVGMCALDLGANILRRDVGIEYWPGLARNAAVLAILFGGFAWMQVHFARFVLWAAGIRRI